MIEAKFTSFTTTSILQNTKNCLRYGKYLRSLGEQDGNKSLIVSRMIKVIN